MGKMDSKGTDSTSADAAPQAEQYPGIDIGVPVEWMIDPACPGQVLGVTYAFTLSGERRTTWYTPNKRRAKTCVVVTEFMAANRSREE